MLTIDETRERMREFEGLGLHIYGNSGRDAQSKKYFKLNRRDGRAQPTVEEGRELLTHIHMIAANPDSCCHLVYLDREDGRFKTVIISRIGHIASFGDSGDSGVGLSTWLTEQGTRNMTVAGNILVVDCGSPLPSGVLSINMGMATLPFDLMKSSPEGGGYDTVTQENMKSVVLTVDGGILRSLMYGGVKVPLLLYSTYVSFSDCSGSNPTIVTPLCSSVSGKKILLRFPWMFMANGVPNDDYDNVSVFSSSDFSIEDIKTSFRDNRDMRLNWPVMFYDGASIFTKIIHEVRTVVKTNTIYSKNTPSPLEPFVKSGTCIVHKKAKIGGIPIKVYPSWRDVRSTRKTMMVISYDEGVPKLIAANFLSTRSNSRGGSQSRSMLVVAANTTSTYIKRMLDPDISLRIRTRHVLKELEESGFKAIGALSAGRGSAIIKTSDDFFIVGDIQRVNKHSVLLSFSEETRIVTATSDAEKAHKSMIDLIRESNRRLEEQMAPAKVLEKIAGKIREDMTVAANERLDMMKQALGLSTSKPIDGMIDTRKTDIHGGVTTDFVRELLVSLGPIDWGCSIINGHVVWFKNRVRFDNRDSHDDTMTRAGAAQTKEAPFIRWETPFRAVIMLSRTKSGWLVTTRMWGVGRHPNVSGNTENFCHGSVDSSVLTDGGNYRENRRNNGSLTLKEALRLVNKAAELFTASISTGDSGRGYNHLSLSNDTGALPLLKHNIFTGVERLTEAEQGRIRKIYTDGDPPFLLPPSLNGFVSSMCSWVFDPNYVAPPQHNRETFYERISTMLHQQSGRTVAPHEIRTAELYGMTTSGDAVTIAINGRYGIEMDVSEYQTYHDAGVV